MAGKSTQTNNKKKTSSTKKKSNNKATSKQEHTLSQEITVLSLLAISIIVLISNFGLAGYMGDIIAGVNFGLFGFIGYIVPVCIFAGATYFYVNKSNKKSIIKLVAASILLLTSAAIFQLFSVSFKGVEGLMTYYTYSSESRLGGGLIGGAIAKILYPALGAVGSMVVLLILGGITLIIITEQSFIQIMRSGSDRAMEGVADQRERSQAQRAIRREEQQIMRQEARAIRAQSDSERLRDLRSRREEIREEMEFMPALNKSKNGVSFDTTLSPEQSAHPDLARGLSREELIARESQKPFHEMNEVEAFHAGLNGAPVSTDLLWGESSHSEVIVPVSEQVVPTPIPFEIPTMGQSMPEVEPVTPVVCSPYDPVELAEDVHNVTSFPQEEPVKSVSKKDSQAETAAAMSAIDMSIQDSGDDSSYVFPPLDLLSKGPAKKNNGDAELRQTALKLEETLNSFGVKVKVTEYSKGPSVTRYELQPEKGVKVSKIVGLADDIKLNLAAADIRIEAPIPGKAAVGIEVPNRENSVVALRSLLESKEFNAHESNLAFAAGKDISGQTVVTDIAKMPHVLIAGSTGSGKSVCINTLIMSILYKAKPEDVKLIMIDPKVVELSVYNGIPHLLIPVVTDPKKAAGALHWAVAEMTKRYQLFAEYNVRDLKGYNEKIKTIEHIEDENKPEKMPQIVVIVDELADLMMVAPGDVEEAICRLAQLARAAGIHLILATQRPSVNVITGLIKANMPSRVAFAVSSGVDSRTIIDMNGAEKLLGKGDMLFYPAGFPKPARVQGAFVSDKEVHAVVQFLIDQQGETVYSDEIQKEVSSSASNVGGRGDAGDAGSGYDDYFMDAGRYIIETDKGSIGGLQRKFKVGFNRAARIMEQLAEAGVVGEEEGTKPRKVLMSISEFEQYIEDYV